MNSQNNSNCSCSPQECCIKCYQRKNSCGQITRECCLECSAVNDDCTYAKPEECCQKCFKMTYGPTGPGGVTGPDGLDGQEIPQEYDPNYSNQYYRGDVVWYGGALWHVLVDDPQGTPGNSSDFEKIDSSPVVGATGPTGPQGPAAPAVSMPYDPNVTVTYCQGDLIVYNGQLYMVNKCDPQGTPGSSGDYTLISMMVVQGYTGPTGPTGDTIALPYDPDQSCYYNKGDMIYYKGHLFVVNVHCPQGIPGQSPDFTMIENSNINGPTGPQGPDTPASAQPWEPNLTSGYKKGTVIYYNGNLYTVMKDDPDGVPGFSNDYMLINQVVVKGLTGPTGSNTVVIWDPSESCGYPPGTLVYYKECIYEVLTTCPQGYPDTSSDYSSVDCNMPLITGPTGIAGPTGADGGDCPCTETDNDTSNDLDDSEGKLDDLENCIDNNEKKICELQDMLAETEETICDITNQIYDLQQRVQDDMDIVNNLASTSNNYGSDCCPNTKPTGSPSAITGCSNCASAPDGVLCAQAGISCADVVGNGCPYQVAAYSSNHTGRLSQMVVEGSPTPTGGTYFGCKVYRASFYGTMTTVYNDGAAIICGGGTGALASNGTTQLQLLPSCMAKAIVNYGGFFERADGSLQAIGGYSQAGLWSSGSSVYVDNSTNWLTLEVYEQTSGLATQRNNVRYWAWVDFVCCDLSQKDSQCPEANNLDCSISDCSSCTGDTSGDNSGNNGNGCCCNDCDIKRACCGSTAVSV